MNKEYNSWETLLQKRHDARGMLLHTQLLLIEERYSSNHIKAPAWVDEALGKLANYGVDIPYCLKKLKEAIDAFIQLDDN